MTEIAILICVSVSGVLFINMLDDFTDPGMIFEFWGNYLKRNPGKWYLSPLLGCLTCSNIWSIILFIILSYIAPLVFKVLFMLSLGHWLLKILYKYELL